MVGPQDRNAEVRADVAPPVTAILPTDLPTDLPSDLPADASPAKAPSTGGAAKPGRWVAVDLLRGVAIVAVVLYHLVWDLGHFGVIEHWAHTPTGRWVGHIIAGTFLFLTGFSLVLAHRRRVDPLGFCRRLGKLLLCAYAITAVSLVVAPDLVVTFGILHDIALTSVLLLPFLRGSRALGVGVAILAAVAPMVVSIDSTSRWVTWTGLTPQLSPSLDVQPLLPGFAVSLAGLLLARTLLQAPRVGTAVRDWRPRGAAARPTAVLTTWGRHTLAIYLVHQPVIFGALILARWGGLID